MRQGEGGVSLWEEGEVSMRERAEGSRRYQRRLARKPIRWVNPEGQRGLLFRVDPNRGHNHSTLSHTHNNNTRKKKNKKKKKKRRQPKRPMRDLWHTCVPCKRS